MTLFFLWIKAEHTLGQAEVQPGFPLALVRLIGDANVDQTLRFTGAVYFKNYIKRNWVPVSEASKIAA